MLQAAYSTLMTLCVTDRAGVQPRPQPRPYTRTFICSYTATRSTCRRLNGLHLRNSCKYMDYYLFTDHGGMEGWV